MIVKYSGKLRWVVRRPESDDMYIPPESVLQQELVDQIGNHFRWEDVPTVTEQETKANAT